MRIGHGYDAHRFGADRPLVLGGVVVPHDQGLIAHSDGDVLVHALCDALLGAAALGDIGRHFPDSDPAYAAIDSRILLRRNPSPHSTIVDTAVQAKQYIQGAETQRVKRVERLPTTGSRNTPKTADGPL